MRTSPRGRWHVVLPVKRPLSSKTRLSGHDHARRALALAFASDTMQAVLACDEVAALIVVTEDSTIAQTAREFGALVRDEQHDDAITGFARLNAAIRQGVAGYQLHARPVAVLTADLPALRSSELAEALQAARDHRRCFVPDHSDTGTSMLASLRGADLHPQFGIASAQAHEQSGAARLAVECPGLRLDVDHPSDLAAAQSLGCGPATARLLELTNRSSAANSDAERAPRGGVGQH